MIEERREKIVIRLRIYNERVNGGGGGFPITKTITRSYVCRVVSGAKSVISDNRHSESSARQGLTIILLPFCPYQHLPITNQITIKIKQ